MNLIAIVFSSLFFLLIWSTQTDAGEAQRARQRRQGTTEAQRAPQRSVPRRAPTAVQQQGGDQRDESPQRAVPRGQSRRDTADTGRRAPRSVPPVTANGGSVPSSQGNRDRSESGRRRRGDPVTSSGGGRRQGRTRVIAPTTDGRTTGGQPVRSGRRDARTDRVVRRSLNDGVGGISVRRSLMSRPIIVTYRGNRSGIGGRGYTPYRGRYRGNQRIYGSHFYFPGYSTFNADLGYGSGYPYALYGHGRYGYAYGDSPGPYGEIYYTGSLRLKVKPRFGEVLVDGYYVGLVDDFDGIFQRLRLEEGPHHIEILEPGFETLDFDVLILPGETTKYQGHMIPLLSEDLGGTSPQR
jgi:hypothetical protein